MPTKRATATASDRRAPGHGWKLLAAGLAMAGQGLAADLAPPPPPPPMSAPPIPGPSNNSDNGAYSGRYNRFGSHGDYPVAGRFDNLPARALPVYFPPTAPRLEASFDPPNILEAHRPAPGELSGLVNEPFYAPLSSRLAEGTLTPRQRQRLDAYAAAKLRLQNELRSHLSALAEADPAARQREFAALARTEDPQIDELERTAEQIRGDLIHGEFLQSNVDWNDVRDWRLGESHFSTAIDAIAAQYQVMRGAAFYQKGLLPAQRRLLREVAMELGEIPISRMESSDLTGDGTTPTDNNPLLYFSPETARIRLPVDLPADLADKVSAYERDKSQLKKELRDVVYQRDNAYFDFTRTRAASALAQQQAARIAALEEKAEDIRRGLAGLPRRPHPPDPPPVSPALEARISDFLHEKLALQMKLYRLLQSARNRMDIERIAYVKGTGGHYVLNLSVNPFTRDEAMTKTIEREFIAFGNESASRGTALARQLASIRSDIALTIGAGAGEPGEKDVSRFLSDCVATMEAREDWQRYADYRTAVLEPGLSPAQRRLLFDAALVDLDLPLPGLERGPAEAGLGRGQYSMSALPSSAPAALP